MDYRIVITSNAEADLDEFIKYLIFMKQSEQAAKNLLNDFVKTTNNLRNVAESLQYCDNPKLKQLGYRRTNFLSHRYFMLYRVISNTVFIDNIFHDLQDYENKMI